MEELVLKLAEILEVDDLDVTKKFSDYEEWDSLTALTIIAMLDSDYKLAMTGKEILAFDNIEAFCKDILSRQ